MEAAAFCHGEGSSLRGSPRPRAPEAVGEPRGPQGVKRLRAPARAPRSRIGPRREPMGGRAARELPNGKARGRRCQAAVRDGGAAGRKSGGRAGAGQSGAEAAPVPPGTRGGARRSAVAPVAPALWAGGPAVAQRGCSRWRPPSRRQNRARHRRGGGRRCGRPAEGAARSAARPRGLPVAGPCPSAAATP